MANTVEWRSSGSPPMRDAANPERAVPVPFRLIDKDGNVVDDAGSIQLISSSVACSEGGERGDVSLVEDAGHVGLRSLGDGW